MKNSSLFLVLVLFLLFTNYYLLTINREKSYVQGASTVSYPTEVSAYIGYAGQYRFSLFGYTSPQALVTIDGFGVYDQTYSDKTGYFVFYNRFSPMSSNEPCLTAQDQLGRLSQPICLPPFPTGYNIAIGPVILPPTLSLDKSDYYIGDEVILAGQTIPNSDVNLSMFTKDTPTSQEMLNSKLQAPNNFEILNTKRLKFGILDLGFIWNLGFRISNLSLIRPVEAFTFPQLQTKSDSSGNFSISLPSSQVKQYRFFARTSYSGDPSAKSNTLDLIIFPIWMIILKFLYWIFLSLKPKLIEISIIIEIFCLLYYILRRYFHPHIIGRNRSLTIRKNMELLEEESDIVPVM